MIRVLLALDESAASFRAAREGVRLFGPDTEFLVISVARVPTPRVPVGGFGGVSPHLPSWDAEDVARLTDADLQQRAADAGANPTEILTPARRSGRMHLRRSRGARCRRRGRRRPRQGVPQ